MCDALRLLHRSPRRPGRVRSRAVGFPCRLSSGTCMTAVRWLPRQVLLFRQVATAAASSSKPLALVAEARTGADGAIRQDSPARNGMMRNGPRASICNGDPAGQACGFISGRPDEGNFCRKLPKADAKVIRGGLLSRDIGHDRHASDPLNGATSRRGWIDFVPITAGDRGHAPSGRYPAISRVELEGSRYMACL